MATILIVEDDTGIREVARLMLQFEGYTVLEACNGEQGLASIQQHAPDLILLDMRMPVMNGLEVLHVLQQWKSCIPVVVMTAGEREREEAWRMRVEHVLGKPFEYDDLLNVIDALVKQTSGELAAVLAR